MVKLRINGQLYECNDEKSFTKELRKEGLEPTCKIKEIFDPETMRIIVENSLWMVNGYVLSKILDRVPDLFKKKE